MYKIALSSVFVWLSFKLHLSIVGTLGIMLYSVIFLANEKLLMNSYNKFIKIFVWTTIISSIIYLFVVVFGINIPHNVIPPLKRLLI